MRCPLSKLYISHQCLNKTPKDIKEFKNFERLTKQYHPQLHPFKYKHPGLLNKLFKYYDKRCIAFHRKRCHRLDSGHCIQWHRLFDRSQERYHKGFKYKLPIGLIIQRIKRKRRKRAASSNES